MSSKLLLPRSHLLFTNRDEEYWREPWLQTKHRIANNFRWWRKKKILLNPQKRGTRTSLFYEFWPKSVYKYLALPKPRCPMLERFGNIPLDAILNNHSSWYYKSASTKFSWFYRIDLRCPKPYMIVILSNTFVFTFQNSEIRNQKSRIRNNENSGSGERCETYLLQW